MEIDEILQRPSEFGGRLTSQIGGSVGSFNGAYHSKGPDHVGLVVLRVRAAAGRQVVQHRDVVSRSDEVLHQVRADEARTPSDQIVHVVPLGSAWSLSLAGIRPARPDTRPATLSLCGAPPRLWRSRHRCLAPNPEFFDRAYEPAVVLTTRGSHFHTTAEPSAARRLVTPSWARCDNERSRISIAIASAVPT